MHSSSLNVISRFNPKIWENNGKTVVLGHGLGTDQTAWAHQVQALSSAGYRVVVFDFAGATPASASNFSPSHHQSLYGFAEDLLVLMQGLDIQQAAYVGHSVGGMIGLLAAVAQPSQFRSLVLLGASPRYVNDPQTGYVGGFSREQVDDLLKTASDNYAAWANGFAPNIVGDPNPYLSSDDFMRRLLDLRPDIVHATLTTLLLSDHRAEVAQLTVPLTVLQTRQDYVVPMFAAQWLAEHGRARALVEIPASGHMPHITAPEAVSQALLACLARD
jgi:sigma-B regulation protein RsbQ